MHLGQLFMVSVAGEPGELASRSEDVDVDGAYSGGQSTFVASVGEEK